MVQPIQRVNVDVTTSMLEELYKAARDLNVSPQAVIKSLVRQALDQHYLAQLARRPQQTSWIWAKLTDTSNGRSQAGASRASGKLPGTSARPIANSAARLPACPTWFQELRPSLRVPDAARIEMRARHVNSRPLSFLPAPNNHASKAAPNRNAKENFIAIGAAVGEKKASMLPAINSSGIEPSNSSDARPPARAKASLLGSSPGKRIPRPISSPAPPAMKMDGNSSTPCGATKLPERKSHSRMPGRSPHHTNQQSIKKHHPDRSDHRNPQREAPECDRQIVGRDRRCRHGLDRQNGMSPHFPAIEIIHHLRAQHVMREAPDRGS